MSETVDVVRIDSVIELLEKTKDLFIESKKPQLLEILKDERVIISKFDEKKFDKQYELMSAFLKDYVEVIIDRLKEICEGEI